MSTYKSTTDVINEIEHWLRLATLLHSGIEQALLAILHNDANDTTYIGLPNNPVQLFNELNTPHKKTLTQLQNNRVLKKEQVSKLLPANGQTNSADLDTTVVVILIINCTNITPPVTTGWDHKKLKATDKSKAAYVLRAREWRNYIHHTDPKDIDGPTFALKWTEGEDIIVGLGFIFDSKQLKTISLDPKTSTQQQSILKALDHFCNVEVKDHDSRLNSIVAKVTQIIKDINQNSDNIQKNVDDIASAMIVTQKNVDDITKTKIVTQKNTDDINQTKIVTQKNTDDITQTKIVTQKNTDDITQTKIFTQKNTDDITQTKIVTQKNTDDITQTKIVTQKNTDNIEEIRNVLMQQQDTLHSKFLNSTFMHRRLKTPKVISRLQSINIHL